MIQMNLSMKQKQIHQHRERTSGRQGRRGLEEGWGWRLGLADASFYI